MNDIMPFSYKSKQVRVIQDEKGNPWWVATDVREVLGLDRATDALITLDYDEKKTIGSGKTEDGRNISKLRMVNEPGLYTLIFKSRKEEAKRFRKWITHDVLPTIRKTGSYSIKPKTLTPIAKELHAAIRIAKYLGLDKNQAILSANRAVKNLTGCDCMEVMETTHLISDKKEIHMTPSDIGKQIGLSGQKANKLLERLGFQKSSRDYKNRLKWAVTEMGKKYAVLKDTGKKHGSGTPVLQLFWLESVMDHLKLRVA